MTLRGVSKILMAVSVTAHEMKDPIASASILPPASYATDYNPRQNSAADQLDSLKLMGSPSSMHSDVASVGLSAVPYQFVNPTIDSTTDAGSVTAQAVVSGMDLQTCVNQVRQTSAQYIVFDNSLTRMAEEVRQSKLRLDAVDILTHNIQVNQDNFESELNRLKDLYNTLAIRSNALGKWMADEKAVRDNLQELYREMIAKNNEAEARLFLMSSNMRTAVKRLAAVQDDTSTILASVMSAQTAMYDWAVNVTEAANVHTTKLDSLQSALQYRITQIDNVIPEMRNTAKRVIYIARSLGETNLAYAAGNVLSHIESVLNSVSTTDTIMSIPTR